MSTQTPGAGQAGEADAREWLGREEIASGSLLALTHLHRYELAARLLAGRRTVDLCCGTGYGSAILAESAMHVAAVDRDPEALREVPRHERIEPLEADALEYVSRLRPGDCDAIVCFEGIEHVDDPDGLAGELARLAAGGVALVVSVPNSAGFDEDNPFHVTDFSYEQALALFERLGDAVVLGQHHAEGSLFLAAATEPQGQLQGVLAPSDPPDPAWANHWVALVNLSDGPIADTIARMRLAAAPNQNDYMRALERANAELRRANARLARRHLGVHDSAAAAVIARLERRTRDAEQRMRELEDRLALEVEVAKQNDRNFQAARAILESPRHRAVDALHRRFVRLPGGVRLARGAGRILRG